MLISIGLLITPLISKGYASTVFYHSDHLGSSSVITESTGSISGEMQYYPFGMKFHDSFANNIYHEYTDQESDNETGLYYYGARYYDSSLAKFVSPDPIREYLNPYSYVLNNPFRFKDPDGRTVVEIEAVAHTVEAMSTWLKPGAELKHFTTVFDVKTVRLANYFLSIEEGTQRIQAGFSQISNVAEKYGIKIAQLGGRAADEVLAMGDINALKAASSELYGINIESAIDLSKYTPEEAAGMLGKNISKLNFFQKMARNRHLKRLENLRSQGLHKKDPAKYMLEQDKAIRSIKGLSFMNILSKISFYLTVYEFGTISHYSPEQRDAIQYQQELGWMSNEGPEG